MKEGKYTMTEVKKIQVIQSVIDKIRTGKEAANLLNISQRQVWRLVKTIKNEGIKGMKHKSQYNKPHNSFDKGFITKIIDLKLSDDYINTNFSHFKDLLLERENISISYSALYNLLTKNNIFPKHKHRLRKTHRRRKRKECIGDLVQADGTPYDWFDSGINYSIHGFIDDASGQVLGLYMCEHECLLGYFEALRQMLKHHGSPKIIYPDKYSVFFPAKSQKVTIEEQLEGKNKPTTQFMRAITTLGIDMFPASTSQAKGRIERLWRTIQDRLTVEFKINNINTIEQANLFLPQFIKKYNKRFSVTPESDVNHFTKVPDYIELDFLLASHITRVIDNAGTFTINNVRFQIIDNKILPNVTVDIFISKKNGIIVKHNDTIYNVISHNDVPSTYSALNLNKLFKDHQNNVLDFATSVLSYDAKSKEPILVTS